MVTEKKIVCVILNYMKYTETLSCVQSIREQDYSNYKIIIVENGSPNESWTTLEKEYGSAEDVILLQSKNNLGFAKGNNIGIQYAHDVLKAELIFVLNSDILVLPNLFNCINKVDYAGVGAISPTVYTADGKKYQIPAVNTDDLYSNIRFLKRHLYIGLILQKPLVRQMYSLYSKRKAKKVVRININKRAIPCKFFLQGCSYFLTPDFFQYYKCLYPNTFLYWEEINLLIMLEKVGLSTLTLEDGYVIHKEGASTGALCSRNKNVWILKRSIESYHRSKRMYSEAYETIKRKYGV